MTWTKDDYKNYFRLQYRLYSKGCVVEAEKAKELAKKDVKWMQNANKMIAEQLEKVRERIVK